MVIKDKDLRKKAKLLEKKRLQKYKISAEQLLVLEELLGYIYVNGQPKASDYYNRKDLVRIFNEISKEIYGKLGEIPVVVGFGSFLMDIFTAKSDLDLSVNFSDGTSDFPLESRIQVLRKFAKKFYALQRKGHVTGVQPILSAKVPILKVADYGTGIECDISVENRDGVLKSQIVRMVSSIDERFQRLSFLMKTWAKAHDINSSKDRTLNSLSIISLVAFHLQTCKPPILPPFSVVFKDGANPVDVEKIVKSLHGYGKENKESLGELFVNLLVKLASVENLWRKGLCASSYQGYWIRKTWDSKISHMSVEDFTDRSENVSRAVGEPQLKKIYKCIHLSLEHISSYTVGKIDKTKLKELLFVLSKPDVASNKPMSKYNKKRKAEAGRLNDMKRAKLVCRGGGGEGWESSTTETKKGGWDAVGPNNECNMKVVVLGNGWGSWGGISSKGWGSWGMTKC
ncbi:protein HESO1-like [Impatiens glandulifera]|uniref:protein HESO1-like n=1 Tax=Impatiens glandulifera TaxID=253017 RepID=UPI001FB1807B|nr:protein HESO1-like [Impatiens glandulifera]